MSKAATAQKLESQNDTQTSTGPLVIDGITFKRPESAEQGEIKYVRANALKAGDVAVAGIYLGATKNVKYPLKLDFKFQTSDGKTVVVNEAGNLGFRMKSIVAGQMAAIIYQGMGKIGKGAFAGGMAHNFEVQLAE